MDKPPVYNEWIHQYADTALDIVITAPVPEILSAKYAIYVSSKAQSGQFGQSSATVPNLVELSLGDGIVNTVTGVKITIPRESVQNLRGKYQHELAIMDATGALSFLFTGEIDIRPTNGRLN